MPSQLGMLKEDSKNPNYAISRSHMHISELHGALISRVLNDQPAQQQHRRTLVFFSKVVGVTVSIHRLADKWTMSILWIWICKAASPCRLYHATIAISYALHIPLDTV